MATAAYTVNSSFTFLTLILDEIKSLGNLLGIDQITDEDSTTNVWDPSYSTTDPDLDNYEWSTFTITFDGNVNMKPLFKKYKTSLIRLETDLTIPIDTTTLSELNTYTRGNVNATGNVTNIPKNQYNSRAPNGVDPTDPYSGIGQPTQAGGMWKTNFIDPITGQTKRATGNTANGAVNTAKRAINKSRNDRFSQI
jgi:hypothetical protein